MAEIKNLTNQLKITGINGGFNDSITFYNKLDNDGNTVLSVRAEGGKIIFKSNNKDKESFLFSEVVSPATSNLEELVLVIHNYIYDTASKKNIDAGYASIVTNTEGLGSCSNYTHDPNRCTVECSDDMIESILFIFNETLGRVLYMRGSEDYTGTVEGGIVTYDVRMPLSNRLDKLYILFRPLKIRTEETYLRDIKAILDESLIQSKLIAMILKESYGSPFSESDVKYN